MLAIRLQRTGRKGHAQYRVVVQEARLTPTSGRVVYRLGNYDPHAKVLNIDKEKASFYLEHGAQPSDRIARLFKNNGVKLPAWVALTAPVERILRNPDKLRKNRPDEPAPAEPEAAADAPAEETAADDAPTEEVAAADEKPAEEAPAEAEEPETTEESPEEPAAEEKPAEEAPAEEEKPADDAKKDDAKAT